MIKTKTLMMILSLSAVGVRGFAVDLEDEFVDDREGRIFTSGGSLNLNSTFLTAAGNVDIK